MLNSDYPYTSFSNQSCQYNAAKAGNYLDGLEQAGSDGGLGVTTNPQLTSAQLYDLLTRGAVGVAIDATPLYSYSNGTLNFAVTPCYGANHAVTLVGFYQDATCGSTWVLKNSWDVTFGEKGYFRVMAQDAANYNCFINNGPARLFKN